MGMGGKQLFENFMTAFSAHAQVDGQYLSILSVSLTLLLYVASFFCLFILFCSLLICLHVCLWFLFQKQTQVRVPQHVYILHVNRHCFRNVAQ